jgi:hypothetical protein
MQRWTSSRPDLGQCDPGQSDLGQTNPGKSAPGEPDAGRAEAGVVSTAPVVCWLDPATRTRAVARADHPLMRNRRD